MALIDEATSAPTDHLVVLEAIRAAPWVAELASDDPIAAAKLRGLKRRRERLKAAGGTLTSEQVGEFLGLSRQAVDKRRASNQLLALHKDGEDTATPASSSTKAKPLTDSKKYSKP